MPTCERLSKFGGPPLFAGGLVLLASAGLCCSGCRGLSRTVRELERQYTSNYSFEAAYDRQGKPNVKLLIAELDGENLGLRDQLVIPLLYADREIFDNEPHGLVEGYYLKDTFELGPLDILWYDTKELHFDSNGTPYETRTRLSVLWRLFEATQTTTSTTHGPRKEIRYAILFGVLPIYHTIVHPDFLDTLRVRG